jgi:Mn2+/Fe2+ NRAMP family transporter
VRSSTLDISIWISHAILVVFMLFAFKSNRAVENAIVYAFLLQVVVVPSLVLVFRKNEKYGDQFKKCWITNWKIIGIFAVLGFLNMLAGLP